MKDGFIKVAAVTPKIRVADTTYNGELIRELMEETVEKGAKVVAFPELCITGYTCGDLFWQDKLIKSAEEELLKIAEASEQLDGIFFVGLPFAVGGKLYNVAAAISGGRFLDSFQRVIFQITMNFMKRVILNQESMCVRP